MEGWLRWSGYLLLALLAGTAAVMWLGSKLPVEHVATVSAVVAAPVERVWGLIVDVEVQPRWRTGLKGMEMLAPTEAGGACWREMRGWTAVRFCVTESVAPGSGVAGIAAPSSGIVGRGAARSGGVGRRVVEIADPKLPFGGTWTYELEPVGESSTRVTVREDGIVRPAMWRFLSHYVMGEDAQVKQYLKDLQNAVGAPVS